MYYFDSSDTKEEKTDSVTVTNGPVWELVLI
jgi:hypothetical protein